MKVSNSIKDFKNINNQSTILTIGTFDGVHIGHQKIINRLNQLKKNAKDQSVILTFYPHPRKFLQKGEEIKMLTTMDEKIKLLNQFGLDCLIIEPFTEEFSKLSSKDFVKHVLVEQLKIKKIIIGYDHQFGKNREGNFNQLVNLAKQFKFKVEEISAQEIENVSVSSTKIRNALNNGNIKKANKYLGYSYFLTGKVVKGKGLGKKINYPTINLEIGQNTKLIPKTGVYIVQTAIHNKTVYGIMNIGYRPTLDGKHQTIEIHLLDFNKNLYGETIQIEILKRLRNEHKFDSIDDLVVQIKKDEEIARNWIAAL